MGINRTIFFIGRLVMKAFLLLFFIILVASGESSSGLEGYWNFDEGSGVEVKDFSGGNRHGKLINGEYVKGIKGSALRFDGTVSCVQIPHSDRWDMRVGFTFSLFLKTSDVKGGYEGRTIIGKPGSYLSPTIFTNRSGTRLIFIVGCEEKSYQVVGNIQPDVWYHIALTFDGKKLNGYINGEKAGEAVTQGKIDIPKRSIYIGSPSLERGFKGVIDEVRLYSRALSAEEILKEAEPVVQQESSMDIVREEGLLGYYPLNETTGTRAFDLSENKNHGRLENVIWKKSDSGSSPEFNGRNSYISIPHLESLNIEEAFTLQAMINLAAVDGDHGIISKGRTYYASGYTFQQSNGKMELWLATTSRPGEGIKGVGYRLTTKPIIKEREWTHVAVTYDSALGKVKFYKDGELVQEFAVSGKVMYLPPSDFSYNTLPVTLSGMAAVPQQYSQMNGFMREVKIYNVALSSEQIKQNYIKSKHIKNIHLKTEKELYEDNLTCSVTISVKDKESNKGLYATVFVKDKKGDCYLPSNRFSYGTPKNGFFYLLGEADPIKLPEGIFEITVLRGFEYYPAKVEVELKGNDRKNVEISLQRFVNMPEKRWFGGEHHIHTLGHGKRSYDEILGSANAAKICEAAGLNYAVFMEDVGFESSADNFIAIGGYEWTPSLGGHLCLINCKRISQTQANHFSNMMAIEDLLSQGGIAVYTHPTSGIDFKDIGANTHSREMPVAVALGKMPIWDVSYGGLCSFNHPLVSDWYRYLNLGFTLAAGASTDLYMNNPLNTGIPGFHRTYVKLNGLSWKEIVASYKKGSTFITSGPMLLLQINGKDPGDTLYLKGEGKETVLVDVEASFLYGINKAEIIKNGVVIETLTGNNTKKLKKTITVPVNETCWLAARVYGERNDFFGTLAHTSPIYIQYGKERINIRQEDIDYFVKWLEDYRLFVPKYCAYRKFNIDQAAGLLKDIDHAIETYKSLKNK
jgi:hypothetical protein